MSLARMVTNGPYNEVWWGSKAQCKQCKRVDQSKSILETDFFLQEITPFFQSYHRQLQIAFNIVYHFTMNVHLYDIHFLVYDTWVIYSLYIMYIVEKHQNSIIYSALCV